VRRQIKQAFVKPVDKPVPGLNGKAVAKNLRAIDLKVGQSGIIAQLNTVDVNKLRKYMAVGILPGMSIKVEQNFPYYLFRIENAQIALDKDLAGDVLVQPDKN
jgi:Fe2+ transport system protein FeoA